jgi:hypothetical protein
MAETPNPDDQDEGSSDMTVSGHALEENEPSGNVNAGQDARAAAEPSSLVDAGSPDHELQHEPEEFQQTLENGSGEEELNAFADDVVSGFEQLEAEESEVLAFTENAVAPENAEAFFEGWDGVDVPEPEEIPVRRATEGPAGPGIDFASLRSLSEMGFASAAALSEYSENAAAEAGKHDELADAVQAALLSVYGQPSIAENSAYQELAFPEEALPVPPGWNAALRQDLAPPADGLTAQDVILNYFDYAPAAQAGHGHVSRDFEARDSQELPIWSRPEPIQRQRAESGAETRFSKADRAAPPQTHAYNGPASFPVPVPSSSTSRAASSQERESSRLLGAAAIGLVGGIAIAASLAAFLIYGGPHQPAIEIPGVGNLRLDRDEQGYGRATLDRGTSEAAKAPVAKTAPDITSEVLASDAVTTPGQPTSLAISVRSQQPFERTLVSITGVPDGGRLSAGVDAGNGNWLLPPRRLNGLTLSLPMGTPDTVPLEVQLLDSNARTPLSPKSQFVVRIKPAATPSAAVAQNPIVEGAVLAQAGRPIQATAPVFALSTQTVVPQPPAAQTPVRGVPASTPETSFRTQTVIASPPASVAAPFQAALVPAAPASQDSAMRRASPRPEVEDLIREGNRRMREGDILEARQFYQKAVAFGDPEAALAMGRSYDPIYFARIDKKNAEPDAAKAFDWYRRAMDAGAAQTAMVRIENLKHFLNE